MTRRLLSRLVAAASMAVATLASADAPPVKIAYQPMISTGLAANEPFEAWFVLGKSWDPLVPGYAIPAGATIRFTFPTPFSANRNLPIDSVMIRWAQGAVPAKFKVIWAGDDPRVIDIHFDEAVSAGEPGTPGLKAIHLRTPIINPSAGDYPVSVEFIDAGPLSGRTDAVAHITATPVPNIAAYNQLHGGQDEDWQRVKRGEDAPIPIDFMVTLPPGQERNAVSLKSSDNGTMAILSDGKPIGSIRTTGVPVTLAPHPFGPGYGRLGIVEVHAKAGAQPGLATIEAKLDEGTHCTINLLLE